MARIVAAFFITCFLSSWCLAENILSPLANITISNVTSTESKIDKKAIEVPGKDTTKQNKPGAPKEKSPASSMSKPDESKSSKSVIQIINKTDAKEDPQSEADKTPKMVNKIITEKRPASKEQKTHKNVRNIVKDANTTATGRK